MTYNEVISVYQGIVLHMKQTTTKLTNWTMIDDGVSTNPEVRTATETRETRGDPLRTSFDMPMP